MTTRDILQRVHEADPRSIARAITLIEDQADCVPELLRGLNQDRIRASLVLGITGSPGAGKSTLTAGIVRLLREQKQRVGILAVDPSSPVSGGALLGDRIRMMDHALDQEVVIRSMATRGKLGGLSAAAGAAVRVLAASGCGTVLIETVGVGQSETDIIRLADISVLVLAPGFGDDIQAMKAGILEVADLIVVNKADRPGAEKLSLDLGFVFNSDGEKQRRLLQTTASENKGVDALLQRVQELEQQYRLDGTLQTRRRRSLSLEALDWTMELLLPRLARLIENLGEDYDPRQAAETIIRQLELDGKR